MENSIGTNIKIDRKEESINYCRIILLMVDIGTKTLLHFFYFCVPKDRVKDYFASKTLEIEKGKKENIFDTSQFAKLTCKDPNPDEFEICMLIKLLNYFKLSSEKLDILQSIHSKIVAHKSKGKLTKHEFESLWSQVETILRNIARCVSEDEEIETQMKMDELKKKVQDVSDREKKIIAAFETWYREERATIPEETVGKHEIFYDASHTLGMGNEHNDKLRSNRRKLIECIIDTPAICDYLFEKEIFTTDHKQEVEVASTPNNRVRCILDILPTRGPAAFDIFYECLLATNNIAAANVLKPELQRFHPTTGTCSEPLNAEDRTIFKMLQRDLAMFYRRVLSKLQISPLFVEDGFATDFFDFYVIPNLSHQGKSGKSDITVHDMFHCKPCQNIYISSEAGCGKTSFAQYLALVWCQAHFPDESSSNQYLEDDVNAMRTFMLLFFVFLRDEHERECDVDNMIQQQLLPKLANSDTYKMLGLTFLQNLLGSVTCLIILDGLDEWTHTSGNKCTLHNRQTPYIRARPLCTTLTTSRPWKLDVVRLKPEDVDERVEINGLIGYKLETLIRKVVKIMNELHSKDKKADDFEHQLRNTKLITLSKIPMVVMQLLTVWFDNESLGKSQSEIYANMIEFFLKRYCKRREIVSEMEDNKVNNCNINTEIPMCFQDKMYCKAQIKLLSELSELAYNTIFTDSEESSLVFAREIANNYLSDEEIETSLVVGILTQEKVLGKMSERQSHISFIHRTFQEYLTALYVAMYPGMVKDFEEKIKQAICSIEKIFEMSQIFVFLSGMCPDVMLNLHEYLKMIVSKDDRTKRYRASCELSPVSSEGQTLWRVQDTMMECLVECGLNGHKLITHLPVSDFFIGHIWPGSERSLELMSLTDHNHIYSLSVCYVINISETMDCLIAASNCIQKLWLWQVSGDFLRKLVSEHEYSLCWNPEKWRHLQCVILDSFCIPVDVLCTLFEAIDHLPQAVEVKVTHCKTYHNTIDWRNHFRSLACLTVTEYDCDGSNFVNLLQFHTNKV